MSNSRQRNARLSQEIQTLKLCLPFFFGIDDRKEFYRQCREIPPELIPTGSLDSLWNARQVYMTILRSPDGIAPDAKMLTAVLRRVGQEQPLLEQLSIWGFNLRKTINEGNVPKIVLSIQDSSFISYDPTWDEVQT